MTIRAVPTGIPGVLVLEPTVHGDDRGHFFESFNARDFAAAVGCQVSFVQDNQSRSAKNVLRGLHYQSPHPQGKLVRVLSGTIFDVAVDLRTTSATYGQWAGVVLDSSSKQQIWVPPGLAHGFLVLSESADILYKTTDYWHPDCEHIVRWNDPTLAINWPCDGQPLLSARDMNGKAFQPR